MYTLQVHTNILKEDEVSFYEVNYISITAPAEEENVNCSRMLKCISLKFA